MSCWRILVNLRTTVDNLQIDTEHVAFAKANFSAERAKKLLQARKRLILSRVVPFLTCLIGWIGAIIYAFTTTPFHPGKTSLVDWVTVIGGTSLLFFTIILLLFTHFAVGRLWWQYIKWFKARKPIEEMNKIIDSF